MNSLLDRDTEELLIPEEGALLPRDLDLTRSDSAALLEACLPHHGDPQGLPMAEAILEMPWQPGFTNLGGFLYLADESGRLLRSEAYQSLTFGPDGRLTSGDPELDDTVAEILNQIICANPDGTRMEWLEESYRYCRDRIVYVPRDLLDFGAEGWENEIGKAALRELAGNCYGYAAAFCLLARGLGYDAWCVSGLALENRGSHGWVEMELDGTLYVFDPEVEHQYMASREDLDLFKMDYYHASGWLYIRP